jgi:hypothetical protein
MLERPVIGGLRVPGEDAAGLFLVAKMIGRTVAADVLPGTRLIGAGAGLAAPAFGTRHGITSMERIILRETKGKTEILAFSMKPL